MDHSCCFCEMFSFHSLYDASYNKQTVDSRFKELLDHSKKLQKKKWIFGIINDFVTKQLPHNVTWGLSFLYSMEHEGDRALVSTQGKVN